MPIELSRIAWLATASIAAGHAAAKQPASPETLFFEADGGFPNSPFPVLWYRGLMREPERRAEAFEALFARHRWPAQWRDGLYDFDHFHSTAHEALGIVSGRARVRLGGPHGREFEIRAGDALVLPAGTGHRNLGSSDDFLMVGAYPQGQHWDIMRGAPDELAAARARIAQVPLPDTGPVGGRLAELWKSSRSASST